MGVLGGWRLGEEGRSRVYQAEVEEIHFLLESKRSLKIYSNRREREREILIFPTLNTGDSEAGDSQLSYHISSNTGKHLPWQ